MKNFLLILLSIALYLSKVSAQIKFSKTNFNLGIIEQLNADILDLSLTNETDQSIYILRIENSYEIRTQSTSRQIAPHETEKLRVKLNPTQKGKLKKELKIYLSSNKEPIEIFLSANVKELPKNNRQACPAFGSEMKTGINSKQTVAVIKKTDVSLFDSSTPLKEFSNVEIEKESRVNSNSIENNNPPSSRKTSKKKKTPEERRNSPSLGTILFGKQIEETDSLIVSEKVEKSTQGEENESPKEVSDQLLDESYVPNNIIFLIDASTSMREEDKMDLLKKAMIELLAPLREIDYLSIVTYSGNAKIVLKPTSAIEKGSIKKIIMSINAEGSTQAVKGIKKAIQVGQSNFIENGNNQIILATDGAFDIGKYNSSLRKKIKSNSEDGLEITVLGIKNEKWTNKSLKEIAELGQGSIIRLNSDRNVSDLLKKIKQQSKSN